MDLDNKSRKQTAQQKLNNFLRSDEAKTYPLCSTKRLILHSLASYCYYKDECNPSYASLHDYTGLTDRDTLRDHLRDLEALNLIIITVKKGTRNKYQWNVPFIADEDIYRKKDVDKKAGPRKVGGSTPPSD